MRPFRQILTLRVSTLRGDITFAAFPLALVIRPMHDTSMDIKTDWPSTGPDDPLHKRKFHKTLTRVRAMCHALPDTDEKISRGHTPIVTVRKKNFAIFWRADGRPNVCLNVPSGAQAVLVQADRERYFVPAYMGVRGWVGVMLDNDIDWPTLEGLIADAHAFSAPRPKVRAAARSPK